MKLVLRFLSAMLVVGGFFFFTSCGQKDEAKTEGETTEYAEGESTQQDSNRGTVSATFGSDTVSINYGRPDWGGSDRLAEATDGMVWRMGMDEATEITTDADLTFGDTTIPKGHYSLWMKKISGNNWELLFNEKTGIWGRPSPKEGNIASVPMMMSTGDETVEKFTIEVSAADETTGSISAMWGTSTLKCDFTVGETN